MEHEMETEVVLGVYGVFIEDLLGGDALDVQGIRTSRELATLPYSAGFQIHK